MVTSLCPLFKKPYFVSGTAYGTLENPKLTFSQKIKLHAGVNKLALLSIAAGLPVSSLDDLFSTSLCFLPVKMITL